MGSSPLRGGTPVPQAHGPGFGAGAAGGARGAGGAGGAGAAGSIGGMGGMGGKEWVFISASSFRQVSGPRSFLMVTINATRFCRTAVSARPTFSTSSFTVDSLGAS
ncbi:hypothetical protein F0U62_18955 [Cystobacter fuscus]|nr:hypothetical protein F0U62_18955 [Cystobacter fuscus]